MRRQLPAVMADALRSLADELLPMAAALGSKKVLKLLARSLHVKQSALRATLRALPTLLEGDAMQQVVDAACAPEETPEAAAAVAALLRPGLDTMRDELLPQFAAAATRLVAALGLDEANG